MTKTRRPAQLFHKMRRLTAELAQIGHDRDDAQFDEMHGYKLADLSKLIRAWDKKLAEIFKTEAELKDALIEEGILPRREKSRARRSRNQNELRVLVGACDPNDDGRRFLDADASIWEGH